MDLEANFREVKHRGWEDLIKDKTIDLRDYKKAAGEWNQCAIGEVMGFPIDGDFAEYVAGWFPSHIDDLGNEFTTSIRWDDREKALNVLKRVKAHKDEIFEIMEDCESLYHEQLARI